MQMLTNVEVNWQPVVLCFLVDHPFGVSGLQVTDIVPAKQCHQLAPVALILIVCP